MLTEKQRRFVEAYMGCAAGNATEAARLAGYRGTPATLAQVGHENMTKPDIQQAIDHRRRQDPAVADRHARQLFWSQVMHDENASMRDRLRASELLGRSQADFIERKEVLSLESKSVRDMTDEELMAVAQGHSI